MPNWLGGKKYKLPVAHFPQSHSFPGSAYNMLGVGYCRTHNNKGQQRGS